MKQKLRNRVAAEKKEERQQLAAKKAEALAAKKKLQAARKRVTVQRRSLPKGPNKQQDTLNGASTRNAYFGARKKALTERSHEDESVSSPSLSDDKAERQRVAAEKKQVKAAALAAKKIQ